MQARGGLVRRLAVVVVVAVGLMGATVGSAVAAPGDLDTGFTPPTLDGDVYSVAELGDGKYLIGGYFTNAGGDADTDYLVRLSADGSLDTSFTPPALKDRKSVV